MALDAAGAAATSLTMNDMQPNHVERRRVAVVLFNLGGPDSPAAIKPFLVNLFRDKAILRVPLPVRIPLSRVIARARLKPATANYAILGGKSPLLGLTEEQARALQAALPELEARCFIAMRYWHPFSLEAVRAVQAWDPDEVLLLPLYPQYSTTTTGSSLSAWREAAMQAGFAASTTALCCYHSDPGYLRSAASLVRDAYDDARRQLGPGNKLRILFSAHGLPETIVKRGDPYQFQIERTVAGILRALDRPGVDSAVCYQSRATPQKWLDPSTEQEIDLAAADGTAVLVVPVAFVSEHSETLVELDVEYAELAREKGVPGYFRAPAANAQPAFIAALAELVRGALGRGPGLCSFAGGRVCPARHTDCPHARAGTQPAMLAEERAEAG